MTYRIAFVGAGARANAHADAYRLIPDVTFVGCFDPSVERRSAFAGAYAARGFDNLEDMLRTVEPDIVHITTPPRVRVEVMQAVSDFGVRGCTVEKPICLGVDDWRRLMELSRTTQTRFGVCHQFRWHPLLVKCHDALASGALGKILLLDASAQLTIADQGTHILHYANYLNGDSPVRSVFGTASGWTPDDRHAGPKDALATVLFENGTRLIWNIGPSAPFVGDVSTTWQHVRVAAYAEHGHTIWEEFGRWEIAGLGNLASRGRVDKDQCAEYNRVAQAAFQAEMLGWIEDVRQSVGTNLDRSLHEWKTVLALYESTLTRQPVELDTFEPSDDLDERLKATLTQ